MRARRRARPLSRARVQPPPGVDLGDLASRATYQASAEHKDRYTPEAGVRRLRTDATACPRDIDPTTAQELLRAAIAAGDVGGPWDDQPFPRYAWRRYGKAVFEARLTNAELGAFKGYPIDETESPSWLA